MSSYQRAVLDILLALIQANPGHNADYLVRQAVRTVDSLIEAIGELS